ncbi:MAG: SEC-C metal-binding domain-containing protein [Sciscionella sp.]
MSNQRLTVGRDLGDDQEERAEIMLDVAGHAKSAGETERALQIYDELIATASAENAQFAAVERLDVLVTLGRQDEVDAEIARLGRSHVHPGPASLVAEFLEARERLDDALTWFNTACRDVDSGEIDESAIFARPELQGRARVRRALGLPPDELDERTAHAHTDFTRMLDDLARGARIAPNEEWRPTSSGLTSSGHSPLGWSTRTTARISTRIPTFESRRKPGEIWPSGGHPVLELVATRVDDLMAFAAEHGLDPKDQQTRLDYVERSVRERAATVDWPPPRNAPCWCDSGRKYTKCCGAVR